MFDKSLAYIAQKLHDHKVKAGTSSLLREHKGKKTCSRRSNGKHPGTNENSGNHQPQTPPEKAPEISYISE